MKILIIIQEMNKKMIIYKKEKVYKLIMNQKI